MSEDGEVRSTRRGCLLQAAASVAVVLLAFVVAVAMMATRGGEQMTEPELTPVPVEIQRVSLSSLRAEVVATGSVIPTQQITVVPEVSGRVIWVSPSLVPGGRFGMDELLIRVDPRDYEVVVEQEKSRLRQAEVEYAMELGRQDAAAQEWEWLGEAEAAPDLAARRPQMIAAEQALQGARSGLVRAEINLERTQLRSPFNSMVTSDAVNVGQVIGPSQPVVTLVGTDRFWAQVSVSAAELPKLEIPSVNGSLGSRAVITQDLGDRKIVRQGTLEQLSGTLDPRSRTATLLVSIADPLTPSDEGPGIPLLPGAFVEVNFTGVEVPDAVSLPLSAVVDGDHVWVVDNGVLSRRDIDVGWSTGNEVVVVGGLSLGDEIVVTPLALPIEGMPVEVIESAQGGE